MQPYFERRDESAEAVVQRCSVKILFLKISQSLQENTCARACFLIRMQACNLRQKVGDKFTKLSKIDFAMDCFTELVHSFTFF